MNGKQRYFLLFGLCVLLSILYVFPQMRLVDPNFIDIAETWSNGTSVWSNTIGEFSNKTRFWPVLKFERSILNAVFMYRAPLYFMYFSMMLATTVFVLILIVTHRKKIIWIILLLCILMYVSPITIDTYWRLGAAETMFALLLVLSIFACMQKKYTYAIVFLFMLMATKESAIFYIPMYMLVFFMQKRGYESVVLGMGYIVFLLKMYVLVLHALNEPGYTSMMSKSIGDIAKMGMHTIESYGFYILILWCSIILYVYRIRIFTKGKVFTFEWGHFFLLLNIAGICTLLSFRNMYQPYYAFPLLVTSVMWIVWELMQTRTLIQYGMATFLGIVFFVMQIPFMTMMRMEYWQNDYVGDNALIRVLEETKGSHTYTFERSYRPEYTPAMQLLSEVRKWPSYGMEHMFITLMNDRVQSSEVTPLCGKTFFGTASCKWAIYKDK